MNKLQGILSSMFKIQEPEAARIGDKIRMESIKRIILLSKIIIPVNLIHIVVFWLQLDGANPTEFRWRWLIIGTHSLIMLIVSAELLLFRILPPQRQSVRFSNFIIYFNFLLVLLIGAGISSIDQLVTVAITPFIITCFVAGIIPIIRPGVSLILYIVGYFVFLILMSLVQPNSDILASTLVNGVTITAFGFGLSVILWNLNLVRYRQQMLIEEQKLELVETNTKLTFYNQELEESNATKNKLFSIIGHDLKSPFNSILGFTQILAENIDDLTPGEIKKISESINQKSGQAFGLLNNLLDWSLTQMKKIGANPEPFSPSKLADEVILLHAGLSVEKNLMVYSAVDPDLIVFADKAMVHSILRNLLSNAIKFTPVNGKITISSKIRDNFAVISVRDSGVGIQPEIARKIFHLEQSEIGTGTNNERGTGLGLQICKEFVSLNGGEIWVESKPGAGTGFNFTLPLFVNPIS